MQRWMASLIAVGALASVPASAADAPRFALSKDGTELVDTQARLAWSRCPEGMAWDGSTCAGIAEFPTYREATALASARGKAEGLRWRVPSVTELRQLAKNVASARGLVRDPFPDAPEGWYWSASVRVEASTVNQYNYGNIQRGITEQTVNRIAYLHAWVVDLDTGESRGDVPRRSRLPVRLVRAVVE
jgi:hypothetical protein